MESLQLPLPTVLTLHNCTLKCTVAPFIFKITPSDGPRRKHSLYCSSVFTAPLHNNSSADHIENTASLLLRSVSRGYVFTEPLLRNELHNPVVLLLRAIMLRALHRNGSHSQSHLSATGPDAAILI
jgi:hypothetical protein